MVSLSAHKIIAHLHNLSTGICRLPRESFSDFMRSHSGTSTGLLNNLPRSKTFSKRFDYKASLLKANTRSHSFPFCNLKLLSFDKKQELPKKHALEIRITFESQSSLEKDILPSTSSISSTVAFSKLLKSFHNQRSHAFETEMFNMLSF